MRQWNGQFEYADTIYLCALQLAIHQFAKEIWYMLQLDQNLATGKGQSACRSSHNEHNPYWQADSTQRRIGKSAGRHTGHKCMALSRKVPDLTSRWQCFCDTDKPRLQRMLAIVTITLKGKKCKAKDEWGSARMKALSGISSHRDGPDRIQSIKSNSAVRETQSQAKQPAGRAKRDTPAIRKPLLQVSLVQHCIIWPRISSDLHSRDYCQKLNGVEVKRGLLVVYLPNTTATSGLGDQPES